MPPRRTPRARTSTVAAVSDTIAVRARTPGRSRIASSPANAVTIALTDMGEYNGSYTIGPEGANLPSPVAKVILARYPDHVVAV